MPVFSCCLVFALPRPRQGVDNVPGQLNEKKALKGEGGEKIRSGREEAAELHADMVSGVDREQG